MGHPLEAQLPGHFDADRLRSALSAVLASHPMGRPRKAPEVVGALPSLPVAATEALAPLMSFAGGRLADTALRSNPGRVDDAATFDVHAGDTVAGWFSAPVP